MDKIGDKTQKESNNVKTTKWPFLGQHRLQKKMAKGPPVTTPSGKNPPGLLNAHAMLEARHGSTSLGMDMTALTAYPHTEMSLLMQSPCRPEEDGYFGATYGIPSKILYEFEMEARAGADVDYAADVVQEHLMDVVLSVTFPSICSYEGDGRPPAKKTQDVVITGFRFGREELDMSRKFRPGSRRRRSSSSSNQIKNTKIACFSPRIFFARNMPTNG